VDDAEKSQLVSSFMRRASGVARRYIGSGVPYDDLISAAYWGLVVAVNKFDPTRGNKFSTMAYVWIEKSVQREVYLWKRHGITWMSRSRTSHQKPIESLVGKSRVVSDSYELLVSALPSDMQAVVRLRIEHGMTMPEAAKEIGVSKWKAWDLERRALATMRQKLESETL
jgi:RNA polymerase sigma factor (sigma-70 family)